MPPFDYHPLGRVVFEVGGLDRLGELARELGGHRCLLVSDPGLRSTTHPGRAQASLRAAGLEVVLFDDVEENPTSRNVEAGVVVARRETTDLIVAVGGGSSMDCAKGINFLLTNGGSMRDYKGFGKATRPMLPSIGVPTTSGTGSEAQSYALIADEKTHLKMACGDRKAAFRVTILDPQLTLTQPFHVTAAAGIDAVTHAVESYVTARRNPLSQMLAREAWRLLEHNLEVVLKHPDDLNARVAVHLGAHYAGMAIEASMLGAAHACANPLTAHYGLTHGIAVGLMLPHVIRLNSRAVDGLYGELLGGQCNHGGESRSAGEILATRIQELQRAGGLPTRLAECGVNSGIFALLAEEANQQWTARFNPFPVDENELLSLYQAAY